MPKEVADYQLQAKRCFNAGRRVGSDILRGLENCGVIHLDADVLLVRNGLLRELQEGYQALRKGTGKELLLDTTHLRANREEIWLPFRHPFNDTLLLHPDKLVPSLEQYLGKDMVLDHLSIIVSPAFKEASEQEIHADVGFARKHLEVHVPLVDITAAMGPTRFCPGSQGRAQEDGSGAETGVLRAIEMWYLTPGKNCASDASTSYTFAPAPAGTTTIYDANVFHQGGKNTAGKDRPVLQLSFASDTTSRDQRAYPEKAFKKNPGLRDQVLTEVAKYRQAWERLRALSRQ